MSEVIWHDLECGHYTADLALWRALADETPGPILDVGAGSGRVTLDLARHGHDITALDAEADLLLALSARARAAGMDRVQTVCADARGFAIPGARFGLILVPMQTIQLLGDSHGRIPFLRAAKAHLAAGGLLAMALADALESVDEDHHYPPLADEGEVDGVRYISRPIAVRDEGDAVAIDRLRETVDRSGVSRVEPNTVRLDHLDGERLELEGEAVGLDVEPGRRVPPTDEHVGSTVVILRG
jgi:SAM-dependent methyltransferase